MKVHKIKENETSTQLFIMVRFCSKFIRKHETRLSIPSGQQLYSSDATSENNSGCERIFSDEFRYTERCNLFFDKNFMKKLY